MMSRSRTKACGIVGRKIVSGGSAPKRWLQVSSGRPARAVPRKGAAISRQRTGRGGGGQWRRFGLMKVVPRVMHVWDSRRRSDRWQWRQHRTCFRSVARQRRRRWHGRKIFFSDSAHRRQYKFARLHGLHQLLLGSHIYSVRAFCSGCRVSRLFVCLSCVRSWKLSKIGAKFCRLYRKSESPSKNMTPDFAPEVEENPKSSLKPKSPK